MKCPYCNRRMFKDEETGIKMCYSCEQKTKRTKWPFESLGRAFSTCEPVLPDDDIIYKGGDNV